MSQTASITSKTEEMDDTKRQVTLASLPNDEVTDKERGSDEPLTTRGWKGFYRSAFFQIIVVSALAFCGPAMSDAVQNLGGGGNATPWAANAATAASYVAVFAVSLFGGPLASRLGVRTLLIFGAATFSINGSSYYVNLKYSIQWWFVVGRTIYGAGFGAWYVAEAAIILSYPEERKRGFYLAVWVMSRNLGQLVGGSINLSRNINSSGAGGVSLSTYLIFLIIECLGFPIAWLISPSRKVRRSDGKGIKIAPKLPWKAEFKLLGEAMMMKRNLLLGMYFFYSYFYGGVLGTYLSTHFSVRARSLSTLLVPLGVILVVFALGQLLDMQSINQRRRAQYGLAVVMVPTLAAFIWIIINQSIYNRNDPGKLDWTSPGWANAYIPFYILQLTGYMCQTYIYWLISCWSSDVTANARQGGLFRAVEAAGQAVSYGLNSKVKNVLITVSLNFGLLALAIPGVVIVALSVPLYRSDAQQVAEGQTAGTELEREDGDK